MGTNYWHSPSYKKWEHMTTGEKVAIMIVQPPMMVGFIYMMCNWFYWSGVLIWLAMEPIIEIIEGVTTWHIHKN